MGGWRLKNSLILVTALLIIVIVTLSGCTSEGGVGMLVLQITDAPPELDITKALVNISNIEVHLIAVGWFTVVEGPLTFDLIAIKDVEEFLGSMNLSVGRYTQIRLQVDSALVTIDGVEYDLKIPSGVVNLISPFSIYGNETTILTLDFDVQESVHSSSEYKYIMNPTIKVIQG